MTAATPPGPTSPDVYDPFEPTKSPSQSPSDSEHANADASNIADDATAKTGKTAALALPFIHSNVSVDAATSMLSSTLDGDTGDASSANDSEKPNDEPTAAGKAGAIHVFSNILLAPGKEAGARQPPGGPSRSATLTLPGLSAGNAISPMKYGAGSIISKLPLPKMSKSQRHNGNDDDMDIASPYSPGADDYEDLFEPPLASPSNQQSGSGGHRKHGSRAAAAKSSAPPAAGAPKIENTFDDLFGSTSPLAKKPPKRRPSKHSASIKGMYGVCCWFVCLFIEYGIRWT